MFVNELDVCMNGWFPSPVLAASIRGVAIRAEQQRHVVVLSWIGDFKHDFHEGVECDRAESLKVAFCVKVKLVDARREFSVCQQVIQAAVVVSVSVEITNKLD